MELLNASHPDFLTAPLEGLFNELRPDRRPAEIARVAAVGDVSKALEYARTRGLQVAVRGGGHNWCSPSLRHGGLLLDLSRLTSVVSIDAEARRAVTEPIVSNEELIEALRPHGLAYPSGHCPTVKLSGYLLSGGMAWNHGVWGPGVGSVEAIEMVLADGSLVTADRTHHADLFWAARGSGPGFFAVAVRYHLRLYPLPRAISTCSYFFPLAEAGRVAAWLGPLASQLPPCVELSFFMIEHAVHGKVVLVAASVFADTPAEGAAAAAPLEECPFLESCLERSFAVPATFQGLFDASGALWPPGLRCRVDAQFSNAPLPEMVGAVAEHFRQASAQTVLLFSVFTGGHAPAVPADALFSTTGTLYGGPWTMWEAAADDAANLAWHERCVELMAPLVHAHYISETDTVGHPEYLDRALSAENRARLEALRAQYDPDGLFFAYDQGLR